MSFQEQIFSAVSEITGFASQEFNLETNLELDLGLDSIKMVGLLNNLITHQMTPERAAEIGGSVSGDTLVGLRTLGDLMGFLGGPTAQPAMAPAAPSLAESPRAPADAGYDELRLLDAQVFFLVSRQLIRSISIAASVRLRGPFDRTAADRAWRELVLRHINLRGRFIIPKGKAGVDDFRFVAERAPMPPPIEVTDLSGLAPAERQQALDEAFTRAQNREWDLCAWPLHRFEVFRLDTDHHEILLCNEHTISDGLGNHVIMGDFMELYGAATLGAIPDLGRPKSVSAYNSMVEAMNAHQAPEEMRALEAYTRQQGRTGYHWNPAGGRPATAHPDFRNLPFALDAAATAALISRTREWRASLNSILVAAYLRVLARKDAGGRTIILQIPTSGRIYPGADASGLVGCFAQNLSLSFAPPAADEGWDTLLGRVHGEIEAALAAGIDRAQAHEVSRTVRKEVVFQDGSLPGFMKTLMMSGVKSNMYLPFTGQTRLRQAYGAVAVEAYRAGTMNGPGTLDVLAEIFAGRLHLFANYDANAFAADAITGLMGEYLEELRRTSALSVDRAPSVIPAARPEARLADVLAIATAVGHREIGAADADRDLEAELGIDSLERIRIITRIVASAERRPDRQALFACRTPREMASVWGGADGIAAVAARETLPAAPASAPPEPARESFPEAESLFDASLPPVPWKHIVRQASLTPEATAVTGPGGSLTYRELDSLSNRIARQLISEGAGPGGFVGIMALRGPNLLLGILGILKTGAAYVPVDPDYPSERIRYILGHAGVRCLITESELAGLLTESLDAELPLATLLFIDEWPPMIPAASGRGRKQIGGRTWKRLPDTAPDTVSAPDDLMVVLYTSGSTGNPKGVALRHRGFQNRLDWHQRRFRLQPGERVAQRTSCCFDISVWELLWPLMAGGVVCAVRKEIVRNPWALAEWMEREKINVMHFVPSLFGEFLRALEGEAHAFPDLRWLIFSGEALPIPYIRQWIDGHGMRVGLANLYGPTEASIDVTCHVIAASPGESEERIPIGKPLPNVHLLILDQERKPVPAGELGELCIGGIQIAVGYLNDPQRTTEAFIPNIYPGIPGEAVYRTGDLARLLPDGSYDYHGRIDNQVKIRGFRVELGEIEAVLGAHPSVRECAVLAVDFGGQKKLVAWLAGTPADPAEMKEFAGRRLAEYMVPHIVRWADNLPKTQNGKLDRKALMERSRNGGVPEVPVPVTPAATATPAAPAADELLPLGPAQRWLVSYFDPPYAWWGYTRFAFNQALDLDVFLAAYRNLVRRHPAMRTRFEQEAGAWRQRVLHDPAPETVEAAVETYDGSHLDAAACVEEMRALIKARSRDLGLDAFPLFRILIIKAAPERYEFGMVGHHMVGDLLSSNLIFRQLWHEYERLLPGTTSTVPEPGTATYPEYVRLLQDLDERGGLAPHAEYWRSRFPGPETAFRLPRDLDAGPDVEASAAVIRLNWDADESRMLLRNAKLHFECNFHHLLLAPLYRSLSRAAGTRPVVLSHRMSGRDLGVREASFVESVGNFAVNFPLALSIAPGDGWEAILRRIKEAFSAVPMKGATYDWIADRLPPGVYPDHRLTDIRVNYLGNLSLPPNGVFEIRQEERDQRLSPADQKRTIPVEIHFSVIDGSVEMALTYSSNLYRAATIQALADGYRKEMADLLREITHRGQPATASA